MSTEFLPKDYPQRDDLHVTIASTATAVPQHVLSRDLVKQYFGRTFSLSGRRLDAVLEVVDNAKIDRRHSILPVDELIEPRPLGETSRLYREHALALGRCVAQRALDRTGMEPMEFPTLNDYFRYLAERVQSPIAFRAYHARSNSCC